MMLPAIRMTSAAATAEHPGAELVTADGRSLPLVSAALRADAQAGLARLVLEQRFENRYDETLHVTYRMPLPADGAVSGYAFQIGDRTIVGRIDKKKAARETFERAIASGHTAALLEQERADIFTQQIGNLPAGEALVARISIDQRLAWLPEGEWELRFPTVIGPRYVGLNDTAEDARATKIGVATGGIAARIRIEVEIKDRIVGGRAASSPTHALAKREDGVIELREAARLDRDIVVRWPVARAEVGASLATARPSIGDSAYGLVTIVPPARDARHPVVPRDLIVLLDTSGSMDGAPLDKAKQVVAMLIETLGEADRLELIEFSNSPRRWKREAVAATIRDKQEAIRWVRSRTAGGGTEMASGVTEALSTLRIGAQRQVVVVTDGYVGGEDRIVRLLGERLPRSCRLHVLGVGSAVNRSLSTALARAGRGAEVVVGPDEDAERAAKRLVDRTKRPMLTNVVIEGDIVIGQAPAYLPDVFEGAPIVAAVALQPHGGEITVRGDLATGEWVQRLTVAPVDAGTGNQAIFALYGREQVADLESRWTESFDREIEAIGLAFQISTRMTSWIAVDDSRKVALAKRRVGVPQELPYGTTAEAFGLRRATATMNAFAPQSGMGDAMISADFGEEAAEPPGSDRFDADDDELAVGAPRAHRSASFRLESPAPAGRQTVEDFEAEEATGRQGVLEAQSIPTSRILDLSGLDLGGAGPSEVESVPGRPSFEVGEEAPSELMRGVPEPATPAKRAVPHTVLLARAKTAPPVPPPAQQAERRRRTTMQGLGTPASNMPAGSPARPGSAAKLGAPSPIAKAEVIASVPVPTRKPSRHWLAFFVLLTILAILAALAWWMI